MRALNPEFASRASSSASSCRSTLEALRHLVREHLWTLATLSEYSVEFERCMLDEQSDAAVVEVVYLALEHLVQSSGLDRLNQQTLESAVRMIKDSSTERRESRVGPIVLEVHASRVRFIRADDDEQRDS
jgi:hypothetical protein